MAKKSKPEFKSIQCNDWLGSHLTNICQRQKRTAGVTSFIEHGHDDDDDDNNNNNNYDNINPPPPLKQSNPDNMFLDIFLEVRAIPNNQQPFCLKTHKIQVKELKND